MSGWLGGTGQPCGGIEESGRLGLFFGKFVYSQAGPKVWQNGACLHPISLMIDFSANLEWAQISLAVLAKVFEFGNGKMIPKITLVPVIGIDVILDPDSLTQKMNAVTPVPVVHKTQGNALAHPESFQKNGAGLWKLFDHA